MKKRLMAGVVVLLGLWGCAVHYYDYDVGNGSVAVYLVHPDAHSVYFVSSADRFRPRPAQKIDGKTWVSRVNTDSEFRYFYIVDGEAWVPDCEFRENDDFGSENCIFVPDL